MIYHSKCKNYADTVFPRAPNDTVPRKELIMSEKYEKNDEVYSSADDNPDSLLKYISEHESSDIPIEYVIRAADMLMRSGRREEAYIQISEGFKKTSYNCTLFRLLGDYYSDVNPKQAYLCYEMASFYSANAEDKQTLTDKLKAFVKETGVSVNPVSIVIVSYNSASLMEGCITSIRKLNPKSSYELIVVDNASKDGITEWLEKQDDITLIKNSANTGFAYACNQGVNAAREGNDIFFLNNDTLIMPNALFWLRMGLYENEKTGATGSITNSAANGQRVDVSFDSYRDWLSYAKKINIPQKNYYEKKLWLVGFALLIRRSVLDEVGVFDTGFGKGNYEDNDLCFRILSSGYELHLCRNSFIYHFGSMGFKQNPMEEYAALLNENRAKFKEKWGFDPNYYSFVRTDVIGMIPSDSTDSIRVLELGCGAGATLAHIKYLYPEASVHGIELDRQIASLGAQYFDIVQGNVETDEFRYGEHSFDYIICADVLEHLFDVDKVLQKIKRYLKDDGYLIASIPNIRHVSVLLPLLMGEFRYRDAGILDRTHVRFFTLNSIHELMQNNGFAIESVVKTVVDIRNDIEKSETDKKLYDALVSVLGSEFEAQSNAYQYIIRAKSI